MGPLGGAKGSAAPQALAPPVERIAVVEDGALATVDAHGRVLARFPGWRRALAWSPDGTRLRARNRVVDAFGARTFPLWGGRRELPSTQWSPDVLLARADTISPHTVHDLLTDLGTAEE